ncbi:MAG: 3',5'-cyclic adenosine monophosphate phosphodiesterase CpdA [Methanoregula sp. SKADARSKE-2]|nr:MAG: 3',5'-cyclic adenosine monophosphate phosphodiesterase CpdA [Methanoregula sp. SKADARSKE-2]
MRVLHTSDWHLGNTFRDRKRTAEFEAFFAWLEATIEAEEIDLLLVSGDIFDSANPATSALELYFKFLGKITRSRCRHVVITAGNHDSPSLLDVPKTLFRSLNIHVIGSMTENAEEEILVLDDNAGNPAIIVCAVPYLRDRDVRTVEAGESIDEKTRRLLDGIRRHYHAVCTLAEEERQRREGRLPLVVMGHLYAEGGTVTEDDGIREHYIGTLVRVRPETFLPGIDYLALGHLHTAQLVGGDACRRYSGSPLPMGFSDAKQEKSVIIGEFGNGGEPVIREIPVPCFQEMEQLTGTFEEIETRIRSLRATGRPVWIEIILEDPGIIPEIQEKIAALTRGSKVLVLGIKNNRLTDQILKQSVADEALDQLGELEIFTRCLDANKVRPGDRPELLALYGEILAELSGETTTMDEDI